MYCVLRWNIRSTHWADSKYYICLVRNHWNCPISTQYATCCFTQQTRYAGLTDLITNTINGNLIICRYNNVQRTEICWRHCSKLTRASCDRIADCMDLLTHTTLTFLMHSHQVNVTCVGGGKAMGDPFSQTKWYRNFTCHSCELSKKYKSTC